MDFDRTMHFEVEREENTKSKEILKEVYEALVEKGYNPINQIVGYIISDDLGYISNYKEARNRISKIDRVTLVEIMLKKFLK